MQLCIAVNVFVCIACAYGAYLARSAVPLSGIPSNVLAIVVGRWAIAHVRRQVASQRNDQSPGI